MKQYLGKYLALGLLCLAWSASALGETLYVGQPEGWLIRQDTYVEGPVFESLQTAVNQAKPGDRIILLIDVHETVHVAKRVSILGYGNNHRPCVFNSIIVTADGVEIDHLHFTQMQTRALRLTKVKNCRITRCFFTECQNSLLLYEASGCLIEENRFLFPGAAMILKGGGGNTIRRNQVDSSNIYGIHIDSSSNNRLVENHIRRAGWIAILIHSKSSGTWLEGNILEGANVGISIQTHHNTVKDNFFFSNHHGLVLARSALGKDKSMFNKTAYIDSDTADERVIIRDNLVEGNFFRDCKREAILLKQAQGNRIRANRITPGHGNGMVFMYEADGNQVEGNTIEAQPLAAVVILESKGNRFSGNHYGSGEAIVRLVDAPDNDIDHPRIVTVKAGTPESLPEPSSDPTGYKLAWGDFHTHSILSDGASTPEELLSYARDVIHMDFVAISDHGEYFEHRDSRWARLNRAVKKFNVPGRFAAIPGFEATFSLQWASHFNVYFSSDRGTPYKAPYGGKALIPDLTTLTPFDLLDNLRMDGEDTLVIRHHYMSTFDYWREAPPDSDLLPMTEICSIQGIWTGDRDADDYRAGRWGEIRGHISTMRGGLNQGHIMAVGGGSDSHQTFPMDSAAVAVLTEEISAESIFEAVRARRTYGTTGARILLGFTLDGEPMGSVLQHKEIPTAEVTVTGTADLREVVLFEKGEIVHSEPVQGRTARFTWKPETLPPDNTYYQVRVRQEDDEMAWSTPIWIRAVPAVAATPEIRRDRECLTLLVYAAVLRVWPDLPTTDLMGLTPRAALKNPDLAEEAQALWTLYETTIQQINARAEGLGLMTEEEATRIIEQYGWKFGTLPPRMKLEPIVNPLVTFQAP